MIGKNVVPLSFHQSLLICMYKLSKLLSLSCLVLFFQFGNAVSYIPQVTNYSVNDYKAGNQNWAVAQDKQGIIYFGNNRGLLQFDGIRWTLYKLPNNIAVRSVYAADSGRIYVGSFEEFGYFDRDKYNQLVYHSLKQKVSGYKFFNDEIWTIHEHKGSIYFQSFSSFFIYDGQNVIVGESPSAPLYFFTLDDSLYAQLMGGNFYKIEENRFIELFSRKALNNDDVVSILPIENKLLFVTSVNGLYLYENGQLSPWNTPAGEILKTNIANRAVIMRDSCYIIGTISNGIIAIDKKGDLLWSINRENHLINNTVLGLLSDHNDNLWVALDNGISHIEANSPLYFYQPMEAQIGMVHDMAIIKNDIYLASNQGVYLLDKDRLPHLVPGTKEQTWYLSYIDEQLLAGHNRGTLLIENQKAERVYGANEGGTVLRKCIIHGKEILLQASYNPLSIFTCNSSGHWQFSHNIEGFRNLIKSFEVDPAGNIWASHMYKGIYRIRLDETLHKAKEVEYIGKLEEENEEGTINVMKLRGRIILTDGRKFYTYEDISGQIVPYDILNRDFPEMGDTYRIIPLNNDLYWFIRNTEYVLMSYESGRFTAKERIPFTLFDNPTIEDRGNIHIGKDGTSYFCLNGGIARYNPHRSLSDTACSTLSLSSIKIYSRTDNTMHLLPCKEEGMPEPDTIAALEYNLNNISFEFSYPEYSGRRFRIFYKLEGYEKEYTEGISTFTKNYSNLPCGKFVMHAVVKDNMGQEIAALAYPFLVKYPFYRTPLAYIIYFLLLIALFIAVMRSYVSWEVSREKKKAAEEKRLQEEQLKTQEQLIIKLKNDKLETELNYKSKELASATLSLITHNDFLEGLKKEILTQQLSGSYTKKFFDKLIHMINDNITNDDEWEVFQSNFDRIHERFFRKLKKEYPDLTPGDLRMCALLRLNMPTKDMARMQNLTIRGIEAARYRLRKKLNLPEGQSLVDFMIGFC